MMDRLAHDSLTPQSNPAARFHVTAERVPATIVSSSLGNLFEQALAQESVMSGSVAARTAISAVTLFDQHPQITGSVAPRATVAGAMVFEQGCAIPTALGEPLKREITLTRGAGAMLVGGYYLTQPVPRVVRQGSLGLPLPTETSQEQLGRLTWLMPLTGSHIGSHAKETRPTFELERAKYYLSEGRMADARQALERALLRWPKDQGLLRLHSAISPGRVRPRNEQYRDRRLEVSWIIENRRRYRGKWVALMGDKPIAMADDLKTLLDAVREQKLEGATLVHRLD